MKVLVFIETGGPGGAEKVVLSSVLMLIEKGLDVQVATLREGWLTNQFDQLKIKRTLLKSKGSFDFNLIIQLKDLIKKENITLVHSHLLDSNVYASIAGWLSKVPVICTEHGDIHHISKRRFTWLKSKIISLLCKKIIAVSYYTRDELMLCGVSPKKIIVLSNPIDFSLPAKTIREQSRWQLRKTLNIPNESWVWINVANLRPVKDQKTLLRGFRESMTLTSREQHLILAGDGELRKDLEKEAERLEIKDYVHFLGFREDVPDLLMASDGFILSSLSEAMPLSLIEASKYKLLLIGTYVGGIPEVIIDSESGFLFEPRNPDDLSEKIMLALTLGDVSNNMREKAYMDNLNRSSSEIVISKLLEVYKKLNFNYYVIKGPFSKIKGQKHSQIKLKPN